MRAHALAGWIGILVAGGLAGPAAGMKKPAPGVGFESSDTWLHPWPRVSVILPPAPGDGLPEGALRGALAEAHTAWIEAAGRTATVAAELQALERAKVQVEASHGRPGIDDVAALHAALSRAVLASPALGERVRPIELSGQLTREGALGWDPWEIAGERLDAWRSELRRELASEQAALDAREAALSSRLEHAEPDAWGDLLRGDLEERRAAARWVTDFEGWVRAGAPGEPPRREDGAAIARYAAAAASTTTPVAAERAAWRLAFLRSAPEGSLVDRKQAQAELGRLAVAHPEALPTGRARLLLAEAALAEDRPEEARLQARWSLVARSRATDPYVGLLLARACSLLGDHDCVVEMLDRSGQTGPDPFTGDEVRLAARSLIDGHAEWTWEPPDPGIGAAAKAAMAGLRGRETRRIVLIEAADQLAWRTHGLAAWQLGQEALMGWPEDPEAPTLALRLVRYASDDRRVDADATMGMVRKVIEDYGPQSAWRARRTSPAAEAAVREAARIAAGEVTIERVSLPSGWGHSWDAERVAAQNAVSTAACAEQARVGGRPPSGRLDLALTWSDTRARVEVLRDTTLDPALSACVQGQFARWRPGGVPEGALEHGFVFLTR